MLILLGNTKISLAKRSFATLRTGLRKACCRDWYTNIVSALYSDTDPKIEQMQIELIRRMPPWKKIAIVDGLNETVRNLAITGIKQRHPNATPEQVYRMLAELMLGSELAQEVYGHAR
jgi:hypothetical protein